LRGSGPVSPCAYSGRCKSSIICEISIDCSMGMHILSLLKL
jgi:hypothetical protein